jgi:hypothetical protein
MLAVNTCHAMSRKIMVLFFWVVMPCVLTGRYQYLSKWIYKVSRKYSAAEAKDFSCNLCVQTSSGAHSASHPMGTRAPFPGGKARPVCDADQSPHLVPLSLINRSYTPLPPPPPQCLHKCVVGPLYHHESIKHKTYFPYENLCFCRYLLRSVSPME